jgi:hypothetical protein
MDAWDAGDHAGIIARRIAHFAANLGFSAPFDGVEGMAHALREAGSCLLRHSVVLDQRDGCAAGAGSPEAGGMAYESRVCLDDSLILRDVSRQSTEPDVDLAVSRRSAVAR